MNQLLDLLAGLNDNPYLLGIEDIQFKYGTKERKEMDIVLTVSTLVR